MLPGGASAVTKAAKTSFFWAGRSLANTASPLHWTKASNFGIGWLIGHTLLSVSYDCIPCDVVRFMASAPERYLGSTLSDGHKLSIA